MEQLKNAIFGNTPFWVLTIACVTLVAAGFLFPFPPDGTIDGSVLAAVGELLGVGAVWCVVLALRAGVDAKVTHGSTSIELTNPEGDE